MSSDITRRRIILVGGSLAGASAYLSRRAQAAETIATTAVKSGDHVNVKDFGAKGDGVSNDTAAVKAFFDFCVGKGVSGHIPRGIYLVQRGVLAYDNGFVDRIWPNITSDGFEAVSFRGTDATNKPMIEITNGTATSAAGRYWLGGSLPSITITDSVAADAGDMNRHGVALRGVYGMEIGWIRLNDAAGSAVFLPAMMYSGTPSGLVAKDSATRYGGRFTNPDPYAVTFCLFNGVEANRCSGGHGRAFTNMNGAGLNFCIVQAIRAIETEAGGLYGFGASNQFHNVSVSTSRGWAVHDGDEGTVDRGLLTDLELDGNKYGIRINRVNRVSIERARIIARHKFYPNTSAVYWPLSAIELCGSDNASIGSLSLDIILRIEAGGTGAAFGSFIDAAKAAGTINDSRIEITVFDNAPLGITDAALTGTISSNNQLVIRRSGKVIFDSRPKPFASASGIAGTAIAQAGFGSPRGTMIFADANFDPYDLYDPATGGFTIPYTGKTRVTFAFKAAAPVGTRFIYGVTQYQRGSHFVAVQRHGYAATADVQSYETTQIVQVTKGDILYSGCEQNSGKTLTIGATYSYSAENVFQVEML